MLVAVVEVDVAVLVVLLLVAVLVALDVLKVLVDTLVLLVLPVVLVVEARVVDEVVVVVELSFVPLAARKPGTNKAGPDGEVSVALVAFSSVGVGVLV